VARHAGVVRPRPEITETEINPLVLFTAPMLIVTAQDGLSVGPAARPIVGFAALNPPDAPRVYPSC